MNNDSNYKSTTDFVAFVESEAAAKLSEFKLHTGRHYNTAKRRLKDYLLTKGMTTLTRDQMTPEFFLAFEAYLLQTRSRETSSAYMRSLHACYCRFVGEEKPADDPFGGVYRGVGQTKKRNLSEEGGQKVSTLDIEEALRAEDTAQERSAADIAAEARRLQWALDFFIISLGMQGISFVDLAFLCNDCFSAGRVEYHRHKTGKPVCVVLGSEVEELVSKYRTEGTYAFSFITDGSDEVTAFRQYVNGYARYNRALRRLGQLAGLEAPLTTYVARHTWASYAYQKDLPIQLMGKALGHSSLRSTSIYIEYFDSKRILSVSTDLVERIMPKGGLQAGNQAE